MTGATALDALIVEQAPDAMICADAAGMIVRWNGAAERLFGYAAHEALGQSLDLIIPPHLRAPHWKGFRQAVDTGAIRHRDEAVLTAATCKNGTRVHAYMSFSLVKTPDGRVVGATAIARARPSTDDVHRPS